MDLASALSNQAIAWLVSLATSIYLVYFKSLVDKRQTEETRRSSQLERRIEQTENSIHTLNVTSAARDVEIRTMRERQEDLRKQFIDEFSKLDQKIDRLVDKIDKVLEHKTIG